MRGFRPILVLTSALLLGGCVYDPYTGAYLPCCGYYGNPYYRYPQSYYPYGASPGPYYGVPPPGAPGQSPPGQSPLGQSPSGQPGGYYSPAPDQQMPDQQIPGRPGASANPRPGALAQRFANANVTHDGRLTRGQAEAAMPMVAQNFDAIDSDQKGYVTLPEIRGFMAQRRADRGQPGQTGQN
jgi:hypothetical protein